MTDRSIFLLFYLPNGTTWFYFSFLLAIALFFKFGRVLSVRNWDIITMFLLVPGLLLLQQGRPGGQQPEHNTAVSVASLVGSSGGQALMAPAGGLGGLGILVQASDPGLHAPRILWFGYLWLFCGSLYYFIRCLLDLALVSRPALSPNLNFGGLAWLAGALFVCLIAVAYRPERTQGGQAPSPSPSLGDKQTLPVGQESAALALAKGSFGYWVTARTFAALCHLAVGLGLIVIGYRHFQDAAAGMAAATFYLMLPYTGIYVGQAHHVWPMVLVVWALVAYRLPILSGTLLSLASITAYCPALTFPIWLSFYWGRGSGRILAAYFITAVAGLTVIALILWHTDELAGIVREALSLSAWQPWRVPTTESFWTGMHWAYRIPVFIAYVAFVITTVCWPVPKNLAHVIALSAAVLIGLQFWYADQGGVYVLWYLPLMMLLVFRPNLSDRRPAPIQPETDWLMRSRRAVARLSGRLFKFSEPAVRTH